MWKISKRRVQIREKKNKIARWRNRIEKTSTQLWMNNEQYVCWEMSLQRASGIVVWKRFVLRCFFWIWVSECETVFMASSIFYCGHTQRHPAVNVALWRNTTMCLLHGMCTLNVKQRFQIDSMLEYALDEFFFVVFKFLKRKRFTILFCVAWKKNAIFDKLLAKLKFHGRGKKSRTILTAWKKCYKIMPILFISFFRFFFSSIRNMLVRDAQTRSLFVFLFVTKLILNMCWCASEARMIEWTKQKQKKNKKSQNKHQLNLSEYFFLLLTRSIIALHRWPSFGGFFFTHQHFFSVWVDRWNFIWYHANETFLIRLLIVIKLDFFFMIQNENELIWVYISKVKSMQDDN